jgi:hypothetical protein
MWGGIIVVLIGVLKLIADILTEREDPWLKEPHPDSGGFGFRTRGYVYTVILILIGAYMIYASLV